jgi:hypothetical protein
VKTKRKGVHAQVLDRVTANQRKAADVQAREDRERETIRLLLLNNQTVKS